MGGDENTRSPCIQVGLQLSSMDAYMCDHKAGSRSPAQYTSHGSPQHGKSLRTDVRRVAVGDTTRHTKMASPGLLH